MKTHIELGISEAERAGLIKVRDYLRGPGAGTFEPEQNWDDDAAPYDEARLMFNMGETCSAYECGTVACIGGSLSLALEGILLRPSLIVGAGEQSRANAYVRKHYVGGSPEGAEPFLHDPRMRPIYDAAPGIAKLFYPRPIEDWDGINTADAADAIDNFLAIGDPLWSAIAIAKGAALAPGWKS